MQVEHDTARVEDASVLLAGGEDVAKMFHALRWCGVWPGSKKVSTARNRAEAIYDIHRIARGKSSFTPLRSTPPPAPRVWRGARG